MTQTANYAAMSKAHLIELCEKKDALLQRIYSTLAIPNTKASLGEKVAWLIAKPMIAGQTPDEKGLVRIPVGEIAEAMGMSVDSASRYIAKPCERFGLTREIKPYTTKAGQECFLTFINPAEDYWIDLVEAPLPEDQERKINGNGTCRCGGAIKKTKRILEYQEVHECVQCGEKTVFPVKRTHEKPLPEGFYPAFKGAQAEDLPTDFTEIEGAQPEELPISDEEVGDLPLSNVPNTPPQMSELSHDLEKEAAQLLLDIAGEHISHIEMCKSGDAKYITIKKPLDLGDIRTHLRGYKTKGVKSRSIGGTTRALWFEGDTPEQWERCKEAAQLLTIMDFKPLLSPSPTTGKHQGGGHLWIIFDSQVDAYSALQTVYQYTGSRIKDCEYWPGGGRNARLPGGKYIYQCDAWCNLYNADGEELSRDGSGNARALLDYQTPAGVVNEYIKPEPAPAPQRTPPQAGGVSGKDLASQFIAEFNAMRDWRDIAAMVGGFTRGKFLAEWRGDRTPNVAINPRTDRAKDFARPDEPPMDKYDVWCRIMAHRTGQDWQLFKKQDLAQRCEYRRQQLEQERRAS